MRSPSGASALQRQSLIIDYMANENEAGGENRRHFLGLAALGSAVALAKPLSAVAQAASAPVSIKPELEEITIAELQDGMKSGRWTARSIAEGYLSRIDAIDKRGPAI